MGKKKKQKNINERKEKHNQQYHRQTIVYAKISADQNKIPAAKKMYNSKNSTAKKTTQKLQQQQQKNVHKNE